MKFLIKPELVVNEVDFIYAYESGGSACGTESGNPKSKYSPSSILK